MKISGFYFFFFYTKKQNDYNLLLVLHVNGQTHTWHPLCSRHNYTVHTYSGRWNGKRNFWEYVNVRLTWLHERHRVSKYRGIKNASLKVTRLVLDLTFTNEKTNRLLTRFSIRFFCIWIDPNWSRARWNEYYFRYLRKSPVRHFDEYMEPHFFKATCVEEWEDNGAVFFQPIRTQSSPNTNKTTDSFSLLFNFTNWIKMFRWKEICVSLSLSLCQITRILRS